MANDWILNLGVTGQQQVASELKKVTSEMEQQRKAAELQRKQGEASLRFRKQMSDLARQERKEAFDRLSVEEKLNKLHLQREQIQQRMIRAQGNEFRTTALQLRLAQTNSAIRGVSGRGGEHGEGRLGGFMEGVGGALRGFLGPLAVLGSLGGIIENIHHQIEEAKRFKEIAEQYEINDIDPVRIKKAGSMTGVPETTAYRGLATLGQRRAAALAGDKESMALLGRYKISKDQLEDEKTTGLDIGIAIRKSLGPGGAKDEDAVYLKKLLGSRWRQEIALLEELGSMHKDATAAAEKDLATLSDAQKELDKLKFGGFFRGLAAGVLRVVNKLMFNEGSGEEDPNSMARSIERDEGEDGAGSGDGRTADTGKLVVPSDKKPKEPSAISGGNTADSLAKVGLFVTGGGPQTQLFREYDRKLGTIVMELQHMNQTLTED